MSRTNCKKRAVDDEHAPTALSLPLKPLREFPSGRLDERGALQVAQVCRSIVAALKSSFRLRQVHHTRTPQARAHDTPRSVPVYAPHRSAGSRRDAAGFREAHAAHSASAHRPYRSYQQVRDHGAPRLAAPRLVASTTDPFNRPWTVACSRPLHGVEVPHPLSRRLALAP